MFKTVSSLVGWVGGIGRSAFRQAGPPVAERLSAGPPRLTGGLLRQGAAEGPPLWARSVAKSTLGGMRGTEVDTAKPAVEIRFQTKGGTEAQVRRPTPQDLPQLEAFLERCQPERQAGDEGSEPGPVGAAVQVWMADNPRHDAFVAVVDGQVVGCATLDPPGSERQSVAERMALKSEGLEPSDVCTSQMLVDPKLRGLGIGKALKQAQVRAAGEAGYLAVIGETRSPRVVELVHRLGGVAVPEGAATRHTVLRTGVDRKDQ